MNKRVIIADDEPITRMDLEEILTEHGYRVVGSVSTGLDAVELSRKENPDIVLMDVKMPLLDGIKASSIINSEKLAGCVILLTAYSDEDIINKAIKAGVMGYVVKPISVSSLLPAIEVSLAKQKEIDGIKDEVTELKEKIEGRKIIEKAKGILSKKEGLSEKESYDYIRKIAMDKGYKMVKVANAIILDNEEFNDEQDH